MGLERGRFLTEFEIRYGIDKDQFRQLIDDLAWLRDYRVSLSRWGSWSVRSVLSALALGLGLALVEGIKIMLAKT